MVHDICGEKTRDGAVYEPLATGGMERAGLSTENTRHEAMLEEGSSRKNKTQSPEDTTEIQQNLSYPNFA
jgi:hypothetical protein